MTSMQLRTSGLRAAACLALMLIASCGTTSDDPPARGTEDVAPDARHQIDSLAADMGADPDVRQDVITDCTPGNPDSGTDLIYDLRVTVEDDAASRLRGGVSDRYRSSGWIVRVDTPSENTG